MNFKNLTFKEDSMLLFHNCLEVLVFLSERESTLQGWDNHLLTKCSTALQEGEQELKKVDCFFPWYKLGPAC